MDSVVNRVLIQTVVPQNILTVDQTLDSFNRIHVLFPS